MYRDNNTESGEKSGDEDGSGDERLPEPMEGIHICMYIAWGLLVHPFLRYVDNSSTPEGALRWCIRY